MNNASVADPKTSKLSRKPVIFTDLDDTLFQTLRKVPEGETDLRLASTSSNGKHSYMTTTQAWMVDWLLESSRLIPVTARSTRALRGCHIPFTDWMIASNGAVLLDSSGQIDQRWQAHIRGIARQYSEQLHGCEVIASGLNDRGLFRHWLVTENGCDVYFCAKANGSAGSAEYLGAIDQLAAKLKPIVDTGLTLHRNRSVLSITPPGVSKAAAVEHLLEIDPDLNDPPVFAMGDGLTDLPFMGLADMMMTPPGSQIHRSIKKDVA